MHEKILYRNKSYRIMTNKTKTVMVVAEMVTEMKPGNRDKEDNAEEIRSLRSRRVNYTTNEKQQ